MAKRRLPVPILAALAGLVLSACPSNTGSVPAPETPRPAGEDRFEPDEGHLALVEGEEASFLAGSLRVVAVTADPSADAVLSLVVYEVSTGAHCVDLVLEDSSHALVDRTGICSDPPYSFTFTSTQLDGRGKTFGVAMGLAPDSVVELGGRRFNGAQDGHLVRALLSKSLPQFDGLVAWAVPVEGWMPSGGDVVTVEGFSADGRKLVDQDICDCS